MGTADPAGLRGVRRDPAAPAPPCRLDASAEASAGDASGPEDESRADAARDGSAAPEPRRNVPTVPWRAFVRIVPDAFGAGVAIVVILFLLSSVFWD